MPGTIGNGKKGRGYITLDKMDEIRGMGLKHGFEVSPFYWGNRLIEESEIQQIKNNARIHI